MSCLVCAGHAESCQCLAGWEERDCPECGRYRMSQALIVLLMEQGQIFDVARMRCWLKAQRGLNSIPSICAQDAILAATT
jgi:hypothetical protein